jgi:mono/diheme cytochrome c family protein
LTDPGVKIVRRSRVALLLVSLVAVLGLVSACVDSSEKDAQTPAGSPTVTNTAAQTNSKGETITAPIPGGSHVTGGGGSTAGGGSSTPSGGAAAGDAAAGKTVFAATCTGCHMADGTADGGVGPKLAGSGLTADVIKNQVINGGGPMPGGLVSGTDLDNVVAYVVSLQ